MSKKACLCLLWAALWCRAAVPAPKEHFGFTPGDDYKLADSAQIYGYFQRLAAASDRIRWIEFGKSSLGKPMYVAFLSAPENLSRLDHYRQINRRLALGQASFDEARRLAAEGKTIVWIDSGLHASEVAPAQHSPELAYRMINDNTPEFDTIRRNVILLQVPVINPDGLDWVSHWYWENVGTPYETAPLPRLYQKYAGHDNNRDWYTLNLPETRNVTRLLFQEWFPQIVYNQHQAPAFPARIFVPPYAEPLNPHIPAAVMEGINLMGMAIKERLARENKPGVLSYFGFDAWWNGGLRSAPAFHNMHGILTETAGNLYATPRTYKSSEFPVSFGNGVPTLQPSIFYERPWTGGEWKLRDAIEYMLSADLAILELASQRRSDLLLKSYQMARASIDAGAKGNPYAYVISVEQWDRSTTMEMLERLSLAGIEIRRAQASFRAGGKSYPEGTLVLLAAQPFRPYLMDLLEPQKYPELKSGASGPTKRPYDIAGWTLSLQMGVSIERIDQPFEANLAPVSELKPQATSLDHRENASFVRTAELLAGGHKVRWGLDGKILVDDAASAAFELRQPRVAVYEPWVPNSDQGWTEWLLDRYKIAHGVLHNADFVKGDLRSRWDSIIFAAQTPQSILNGFRTGEITTTREGSGQPAPRTVIVQRPEYVGGIGAAGLEYLQQFVREGGTLIALDTAAELPIQFFPLPLRNLVRPGPSGFYCPGSLLRITVDTSHPIAFGMPKEAIAFSTGGEVFDITLAAEYNKQERQIRSVARFATSHLLASGFVAGESAALGKHALLEARYGRGRVVLFAFRPQFRGQPYGAFKFLLNAIYLASAQPL